MPQVVLLSESIGGVKVNRETRTVENVCLLGRDSRNGWNYSEMIDDPDSPGAYEGRSVFLDHYDKGAGKKPTQRSVRDFAGTVQNIRKVDGRLRGDFKAVAGGNGDTLLNVCESMAMDFGPSHVVDALVDERTKKAKKLHRVYSVDLVAFPATTTLRESEDVDLELIGKLQGILATGGKPVEVLKQLAEACEVTLDESKLDQPKTLSEQELADIESDRAELQKFRKEKLAAKAIADHGKSRVKATPDLLKTLSEQADEAAMASVVKVLAEQIVPGTVVKSGLRQADDADKASQDWLKNAKGK